MWPGFEFNRLTANAVFDLVDRYARDLRQGKAYPRPIGPATFRVLAQWEDGQRRAIDEPPELVVQQNPGGYHLFFGRARRRDAASTPVELTAGRYELRIDTDLYQRHEFIADLPKPNRLTPYGVDLEPGYAYPFPGVLSLGARALAEPDCAMLSAFRQRGTTLLRGGLHGVDGRGVAGARVQVVGHSNTYVTDESGQWVLVFGRDQVSGVVTVRIDLPGGITAEAPGVCVVQGCEMSLHETALRGWVVNASGVRVAGAQVEVLGRPGCSVTEEDGRWHYYFGLDQEDATVDIQVTQVGKPPLILPHVQVLKRRTGVVPTIRL